uniref:Phage methyltransferase n=1 Tax=Edwardsiella phage eiAU TaxID=945083 RepID=E7EKP5_9CAUD|nr:phage methyltransferase [Edwardsiella phage eiAU]
MTAYYNEIDPYAAQWLRNLIAEGHIAPGIVDERSIEDITPNELTEFTQCHFFAGIGVWSLALRRAGWPDDRPVWTGSCPCQPFSAAGKGAGVADERHLWPAFFHLISQCSPSVVFGEQVSSKDGLGWLDIVQTDLENAGYASAAADLCAAGVGAPHIRQRLYWVADANHQRQEGKQPRHHAEGWEGQDFLPSRLCDGAGVSSVSAESGRVATIRSITETGQSLRVADAEGGRWGEKLQNIGGGTTGVGAREIILPAGVVTNDAAGPTNGHWRDSDWLSCRDGKWRPLEPWHIPVG